VKANSQEQKTLLAISELDLEISKVTADRKKLADSSEISKASALALSLSDQLIDARNIVGDLEMELKRAENDLELVETRIAKDIERLATTSSAKDAQGIEHELETLAKRKSDLEDAELAILEALEHAKAELEVIVRAKAEADSALTERSAEGASKNSELEAKALELSNRRSQTATTLSEQLLTAFEQKSRRGPGIGRLIGRECGSCRLSITASNFDEISSLPADELAECPNCQAFLVRS
jgi:uncharacterized protein